jgi:hypothetical protein
MAVCIFGIGVMGVVAMQGVVSTSNRHAKALATATHIAQSWVEHMAVDATRWNQTYPRSTNTVWLSAANGNWVRPDWNANENFGAAFDALGQPLDDTSLTPPPGTPGPVFCTHVRLVSLIDELNSPGHGLMRVDVRVFWARDGEANTPDFCTAPQVLAVGSAPDRYHFVYKSTAVRQTSN